MTTPFRPVGVPFPASDLEAVVPGLEIAGATSGGLEEDTLLLVTLFGDRVTLPFLL
jgi:hypothetical protein